MAARRLSSEEKSNDSLHGENVIQIQIPETEGCKKRKGMYVEISDFESTKKGTSNRKNIETSYV